ncbi:MAG TPA: DsrE family protein, partial [Gammaproteobacteria bacterium]|nr:DsrE family protein [Gammaproteobacteria bacterium]
MQQHLNRLLMLFCASLLVVSGIAQAGDDYPYPKGQKVVYQVDQISHASAALRNVGHHLDAVGTPIEGRSKIAVVTHSGGVFMLLKGSTDRKGQLYEPRIQNLMSKGVQFLQCANTLRGHDLHKSDLVDGVKIVPSGVAEIAERER